MALGVFWDPFLLYQHDWKISERGIEGMYIFPGYVTYAQENDSLIVASKLLRNKVKISDSKLQEEFLTIYSNGGCTELCSDLTRFLHEQELLLTEVELTRTLGEVKSILLDQLLLTIMPTEACNFCCPYCYEAHSPITMSNEILAHLKNYISENAPRYRDVCVSWFGGEPTLCKEIVIEISSLIVSLQAVHGFCYSASMTTNGYLLDSKTFLQYYNVGIRTFQITVDGWSHDSTRPLKSGGGTLQRIMDNLIEISKIPKEEYQFEIILRRNILPGDEDYSWYDHMKSLFGHDNRFSVSCFPVSDWGGESVKTLNLAWSCNNQELIESHIAYATARELTHTKEDNALLTDVCYASCPGGLIFRADGRIEKCTIALNHPKNQVGYIDSKNGVIIDEIANMEWCSGSIDPKCYRCVDILNCMNITCKKGVIINGHTKGFCMHSKVF